MLLMLRLSCFQKFDEARWRRPYLYPPDQGILCLFRGLSTLAAQPLPSLEEALAAPVNDIAACQRLFDRVACNQQTAR